ncbi:MAG: ATP-binding cassette domain-containing protein [Chloroflexi bacterium]|nr:ATP-binding cassette domain-containing protein [Chloroflexota bacterium]
MTISHQVQPKIPLISMREISKEFPGVLANNRIDFEVYPAEIHALLGENGAGKSTLVKILYGFYRADSGRILHNGTPVTINSPQDARDLKIGMVFQNHNLIPALNVAENIALFLPELPFILQKKAISDHIHEISSTYNLQVDPEALVSQLSIGEQQKVEILKLLLSDARILILDEPTRVLAPHEIDSFFEILFKLREDDYSIIMITHKMNEVLTCADRITVLRQGGVADSLLHEDADEATLIKLMFGKQLPLLDVESRPLDRANLNPVLELQDIETEGEGAETSLHQISLKLFPGELVGVAGVSGNGQKELGDLVLGMISSKSGKKIFNNQDITQQSIQDLRKQGLAFIPENPLVMATIPYMTVLENFVISSTWRYGSRAGMSVDWSTAKKDLLRGMEELGFELPLTVPATTLSGGNLQRLVIIRELSHNPLLIVASYLTRGLDVQSTLAARDALLDAKDQGAGILLLSEDLEELFELSDRIIVLYQGRIAGEFLPSETDRYEIGHVMTGIEVENVS